MSSIVSEPTENSTKQADVITRASDNSLGLTKEALAELNEAYGPLDFESRIKRLYQDFNPEKILVTSSFASTERIEASVTLMRSESSKLSGVFRSG